MAFSGTLAAASRVLDGARGVARVFRADASEGVALEHAAHQAALSQYEREFVPGASGFDRFVNGLNRLPRPFLAFGTLGLFIYAMTDPLGFAERMQGLAFVPEPLWWLLGAIVGFYFGARELHHLRAPRAAPIPEPVQSSWHHSQAGGDNAALTAWRSDAAGDSRAPAASAYGHGV